MPVPKSECQYCHREISTSYLQTHIRKQHQIYGGRTGRPRKTLEDFSVPTAHPENGSASEIVVPLSSPKPNFRVVDFLVLEDQDGGLWLAERLR